MNTPKEWWGDPKNAEAWIAQSARYKQNDVGIFVDEVKKTFPAGSTILEVGSGSGRLIGELSKAGYICESLDINPVMAEYVSKKYNIKTHVGEIVKLPFKDKTFDLVFTFQVLQHVPKEEIKEALKELSRVGHEVWMWEGIGRLDSTVNARTHYAHGGSWYWDIAGMIHCYEVLNMGERSEELKSEVLYKTK